MLHRGVFSRLSCFFVYTNEVVSTNALLTLVKFADDMALVARLQDENSLAEYFLHLDVLNSWFKESGIFGSKYFKKENNSV